MTRIAIISGLCVFAFCGIALAELNNPDLPNREGIKIGDIYVHGALKTSEELETNIFLSNDQEKFDAITLLNPSVGVEIPLKRNKISLDYDAGVFMYGTYNTENHIDHRARALAEINLTDYKITISDVFRDFTDRASDENSRRIGRQNNKGRVGVEAQFNRLGFDVGYTNIIESYSQEDDLLYQQVTYGDKDRVYNVVDGTVSYRILPKTSLFFESDLGFIHYYNSSLPPDSWFIQSFVGLKGKPTNKMLANIKVGMKYQAYDKSAIYNDKSFTGFVAAGGLDYFITDKDTLNFGIEKNTYESLYQNMNYYDAVIVSLNYRRKFHKKFSFNAFGSYQLNLYPGQTTENGLVDKRYDNFFAGGTSLRYDIRKWASLEFKYEYDQRKSRFGNYSYVDNRIIFSGTGGF